MATRNETGSGWAVPPNKGQTYAPEVLTLAKQALNFGAAAAMAEAMANEQNLSSVLREGLASAKARKAE